MQSQYATENDHVEDFRGVAHPLPQRISDCIGVTGCRRDRLALVDSGGSWTYCQLQDATDDMESWLLYLGTRAGDRVMIVAENCRALIAMIFALARIDACAALVDATLSPQEVDHIKTLSAPRRIFYTINVSEAAKMHAVRHKAYFADNIDWGPIAFGPLNDNAAPQIVSAETSNRVAAEVYSRDEAGEPRSEKLTHKYLLVAADACTRISGSTSGNPLYGSLPMYDGLGLSVVLLPTLLTGGTVCLSRDSHRLANSNRNAA